jgi:hypothetical protein
MKRIVVLFLWFYCTASVAVLNIPNEEPGSSATVTAESPKVNVFSMSITINCFLYNCMYMRYFAGTDMSGKTTWVKVDDLKTLELENCSADVIAKALKGGSTLGKVTSSPPDNRFYISPQKGSYRMYGYCNSGYTINNLHEWNTDNQPWDGIPPPVCWLSGPDIIDFGELKPAAVSGKSKKARYTISCDKKATVKVTFAFASGSSSEKIADDLTLGLKVGTKDGVKGETYTVEKSAVQADLNADLKSGGAAPVGEYQASAVVKLTVE